MVFPVVMYGCESWTVKKAECRRIDAFELWCWRRLLRVPWTVRRSNQSILKEISPGCSLEGLMLKLKLQYFGHLMRRVDSLEKTLMLGGIGAGGEGDDGWWDGWIASPTRWTWVWVNSGSWWWTGRPGMLEVTESQTRQWLSWTCRMDLEREELMVNDSWFLSLGYPWESPEALSISQYSGHIPDQLHQNLWDSNTNVSAFKTPREMLLCCQGWKLLL